MKTITIKQPWAHLICAGIKDIENRTWATKFRGKVLVHASAAKWNEDLFKTFSFDQTDKIVENDIHKFYAGSRIRSAIIGSVEIIDCVINHESIWAEKTDIDMMVAKKPIYNWVLANPIMFPEPILAKGKLSFWDYPNILAEPEEKDGELFCHCQLPVKEENQVMSLGDGHYRCRYCGGIWYK